MREARGGGWRRRQSKLNIQATRGAVIFVHPHKRVYGGTYG